MEYFKGVNFQCGEEKEGIRHNFDQRMIKSVTIFDGVDLPHGSLLLKVLVDLLAEQVVLGGDSIAGVAHPLSHLDRRILSIEYVANCNFLFVFECLDLRRSR